MRPHTADGGARRTHRHGPEADALSMPGSNAELPLPVATLCQATPVHAVQRAHRVAWQAA